ncbi:Spermidine/putrescine-binding periplasmic protein 1 [Halomicronema hongdechloris C2206]|uniref:Spermidine/putrescine-binding periplasmic protein 1 n=1 Tax=Halomicronema hongdechloris C2206 TaxID=1641165 RepID=A0A1Z3HGD9_9CYAN|nr:extracellular solute-binding protein [Halomicronema hongdechloris]ASC69363.1 Spermidine/putrescine-binding periplasmic protein 1 [Halomicronema hongdechloris C2206]
MKRRTFLQLVAATIGLGLSACGPASPEVEVRLLEGSIPARLIKRFKRQSQASATFTATPSLLSLFQDLRRWQRLPGEAVPRWQRIWNWVRFWQSESSPGNAPDWVSLGDYWLTAAVQEQLIQPLRSEHLPGWQRLSPAWQQLVRRDRNGQFAEDGAIWAVPYRWGSLIWIYDPRPFQRLGWQPSQWQDLWHPDLQRRFALPDHPRLVLGLALKALNQSANSPDVQAMAALSERLQTLQQQVQLYSSEHGLKALINGDLWLIVGWSTDLLPQLSQYRQFQAGIPQEGTILTADLWVRPTNAPLPLSAAAKQWIEFCLTPDHAAQLSLLSQGGSPLYAGQQRQALPSNLQEQPLIFPPADLYGRSEFLQPLSDSAQTAYDRLWQEMRSPG